jgi:amidohydrolase
VNLPSQLGPLLSELVALRRDFHRHPELGFREYRTRDVILDRLKRLDIETHRMAKTGVVGLLSGDHPGPTLLLRADMDALPIQEETGLPYRSETPGVMHACGHDGHLAMLLVAADLLCRNKARLHGRIVFAFQPNEEDAGAGRMVAEGVLDNPRVDAAFGCHLWSELATGDISVADGPVMAASHYFTLTIQGVGGHAGFVHQSVDPIFTASAVIQAAQAVQTREIDALHPAVILFTRIEGGTSATIVPETVLLEGSIRFLYEGGEEVLERFTRVVTDTCRTHRATCDIEFKTGNHILANDPAVARRVRLAAAGIAGSEKVRSDIRTMAGEDFAEFARRVPAAFAFVGCRDHRPETAWPHHHPRFDIDENALAVGTELFIRTAFAYLGEER